MVLDLFEVEMEETCQHSDLGSAEALEEMSKVNTEHIDRNVKGRFLFRGKGLKSKTRKKPETLTLPVGQSQV